MKTPKEIVKEMTFEQKALFLTGRGCRTMAFPDFGVPSIGLIDGPQGVRNGNTKIEGGHVCMPTASCVGASWDRDTAFLVGRTIAKDCVKENFDVLLAPGVNMKRTPHCGRNFEYFSEDPVLAGELAAAYINGVQSEGIGTCLKHFAVNNQELDRLYINSDVDERTLREYYLKAFEVTLANSSPTSIMNAYNKIGGIWCSENKWLLTEVLRHDFCYDGAVVSDWGSVHDTSKAIMAGLTIEMPENKNIIDDLRNGIKNGILTEEKIDEACETLIKFVLEVNKIKKESCGHYDRTEQHKLAQIAAAQGITLLQNDNNVLPITNKKYKKIGVYGRHAERVTMMGSGSSKVLTKESYIDQPIDYIKKYCEEENIELDYDPLWEDGFMGAELVAKLNDMQYNKLDAIIIFIGDNYGADTETEYWDRENITFPNYLNGIIESACNTCSNVIVVMETGSATIPHRWYKRVDGIIQMWYAGEGGGKAVADIIFGKTNPSGKLSETFITKVRDDIDYVGDGFKTWYKEGLFVGYRYYDEHSENVWFPFGHGLSYATFEYSDIKLDSCVSDNPDKTVKVSFKVKNTGNLDGKEVVQLYVGEKNAVVTRPVKELKRFIKIYLKAGEDKTVEFTLGKSDFAYFNQCLHEWHVESGKYNILVGASSADIRLQAVYEIEYKNDYSNGGRKSELTMQHCL